MYLFREPLVYGKTVYTFLFTVVTHHYRGLESRLYIFDCARYLDSCGMTFFRIRMEINKLEICYLNLNSLVLLDERINVCVTTELLRENNWVFYFTLDVVNTVYLRNDESTCI